jgi:hypothetical protein
MPTLARVLLAWTAISMAVSPLVGSLLAHRSVPQPVKA